MGCRASAVASVRRTGQKAWWAPGLCTAAVLVEYGKVRVPHAALDAMRMPCSGALEGKAHAVLRCP